MLVEEEPELGGHLRFGGRADLAARRELREALSAQDSVEVLLDSVVAGRYDHNWIAVVQRSQPGVPERLIKVRAGALIVAPGLIERPYVFSGNDLPGVMLSTAARRLINLWAVRPGQRAVVLTANPEGDDAVADLEDAGVEIARIVDARRGEDVVRARGNGGLAAVELGDGTVVEADLLVTAVGWTAPTSLLNMAGDRPRYAPEAGRFLPGDGLPDSVLAVGGLAGDGSLDELVGHAQAMGTAAARGSSGAGRRPPPLPVWPQPALFRSRTHGFVDFSEDISSKDLFQAAGEATTRWNCSSATPQSPWARPRGSWRR
jgi:NAD(P)H-nitrite reductase